MSARGRHLDTRLRARRHVENPGGRALVLWVGCLLLPCCEQLAGLEQHSFGLPAAGTGGRGQEGKADAGRSGPSQAGSGGGSGDVNAAQGGSGGTGHTGGAGAEAGGLAGTGPGGSPELAGEGGLGPAPPTVTGTPSDVRGVALAEPIVLRFSRPMQAATVDGADGAYTQTPGSWTPSWNDDETVLTIWPQFELAITEWQDSNRPAEADDLLVSYGVKWSAQDKDGLFLGRDFAASYSLMRSVEHELSVCLDLSGTAREGAFDALVPEIPSEPCLRTTSASSGKLATGDLAGESVVALMTFALSDVPPDVTRLTATLEIAFGAPVGAPHARYGKLLLEELGSLADPTLAFAAEGTNPLTLAPAEASYPWVAQKDVTRSVSAALSREAAAPFVQFRARFDATTNDANQAPDYLNLNGGNGRLPRLLLSYECAECP